MCVFVCVCVCPLQMLTARETKRVSIFRNVHRHRYMMQKYTNTHLHDAHTHTHTQTHTQACWADQLHGIDCAPMADVFPVNIYSKQHLIPSDLHLLHLYPIFFRRPFLVSSLFWLLSSCPLSCSSCFSIFFPLFFPLFLAALQHTHEDTNIAIPPPCTSPTT